MAGHRRAAVLVDDKRDRVDAVAAESLGEELLGQRAVLVGGDDPRDDVAAEQIEDDVKI